MGSYGTTSTEHPSVQELFEGLGKYYVGGTVHGLMTSLDDVWGSMGKNFKTPAEVRASLPAGKSVVAFQNRNPVHKAHFELFSTQRMTSRTPSFSCTLPLAQRSLATSMARL